MKKRTDIRNIRRRDFLNGVLVGAGGLFGGSLLGGCGSSDDSKGGGSPATPSYKGDLYASCHDLRDGKTWDIPAPEATSYDCIIVGGGISGLTAAWKLRKLGKDNILLLDKDEPVGGLSKLDGTPPLVYSQGTAYTVYPYNDGLIELYTDLGVVTGTDADGAAIVADQYLLKTPVNNVYVNGAWVEDAWEAGLEQLPFDAKLKTDLTAFREDMKTWYDFVGTDGLIGFDTPSDASTADADVRALDTISLSAYVTKKGWDSRVAEFFDPYARSAFGTTTDKLSAWAAINFLGSEFHPTLSQPGGNAYLGKLLADKIGAARLTTKAFVYQIKNVGSAVQVTFLDGDKPRTLEAKTVIYAAPRFFASYLIPELAAAGRHEADDFAYTAYLVANIHLSKAPAANLGYDNWVHTADSFFTDFIVADWAGQADPKALAADRKTVLTVYAPQIGSGKRSELLSTEFAVYEQKILDDLEKVLPGVSETVTGIDLYRWGHAMLVAQPGFVFGKSRVDAQAPLGNIFFANNDVDGLPAFENAVASAVRAATEAAAVK